MFEKLTAPLSGTWKKTTDAGNFDPTVQHAQFPKGYILNDMFVLDGHIDKGGMAAVYRAKDAFSDKSYAIKVLPFEDLSDPIRYSLFKQEAEILEKLKHRTIVNYLTSGKESKTGRPFIVMDYINGAGLDKRIKQGPVPFDDVIALAIDLAEGLSEVHSVEVVHRDISPDNILLEDGDIRHPKIIDFGILKDRRPGAESFIAGAFAGKLLYASPDHAKMFQSEVTGKSDIYSLGLVIAAAARGGPLDMDAVDPIGGPDDAWRAKREKIPDLSDIDPRLQGILVRMLEPDPKDRIESMAAVVGKLKEFVQPENPEPDFVEPRSSHEKRWSKSGLAGRRPRRKKSPGAKASDKKAAEKKFIYQALFVLVLISMFVANELVKSGSEMDETVMAEFNDRIDGPCRGRALFFASGKTNPFAFGLADDRQRTVGHGSKSVSADHCVLFNYLRNSPEFSTDESGFTKFMVSRRSDDSEPTISGEMQPVLNKKIYVFHIDDHGYVRSKNHRVKRFMKSTTVEFRLNRLTWKRMGLVAVPWIRNDLAVETQFLLAVAFEKQSDTFDERRSWYITQFFRDLHSEVRKYNPGSINVTLVGFSSGLI